MLNKSYNSIFDFVNDKIRITYNGKIKVVENNKESFLNRQELKNLCSELKEKIENKRVKLFVKRDCIIVEGL